MADAWGRSWGGTFIVWGAAEQAAIPGTYGAPFADFQLTLSPSLDFLHKMNRDVLCLMPSARVDIDGESEP